MARIISMMTLLFFALQGISQSQLIINGGVINITNGAVLVVDNPNSNAITQTGSGYIESEGATNKVIWTIGIGNAGTYLVPFGNGANYLPVSFNAASGSDASGQIVFSTYPTPTWKNSDDLPPGVTNVNSNGVDNSANVIDRFWQINPQGYSTKPTLTNLAFTYSDNEYAAPNTITESSLIAQRWNNILGSWNDYFPPSSINTVANTITVSSIDGSQLYDWWTMVSSSAVLPVRLVYFTADVQNKKVITNWQTAFEQNTDHFEVWRSKNGIEFNAIGLLQAAGNSALARNYTLTDATPYVNTSFYRLKTVDKTARFQWSPIVSVNIIGASSISLYPNPATTYLTISTTLDVLNKKPIARLYDDKESLLKSFFISSTNQQLDIQSLAGGAYHISIHYNNQVKTLTFIKK